MSVRTIFELRTLHRLGGYVFSSLRHFDELESTDALAAYEAACRTAPHDLACELTRTSVGGVSVTGVCDQVHVQLASRKCGETWLSAPQIVGAGTEGECSKTWPSDAADMSAVRKALASALSIEELPDELHRVESA